MEIDITNRLTGVKIVTRSWTPEGGSPVNYKQIVLVGVLNGNVKEVPLLRVPQAQIELIEAFSERDNNTLV